jgi:mannose-6-phosphate isomerase
MSLAAYADWIRDTLLPFWLPICRDPRTGLFFEKLHLDGTPDLNADLRLRTQFRQVYTLAHAAEMGLVDRAAALTEAEAGVAALVKHALSPDGLPGWAAVLSPDGSLKKARRDLYDHAFVLLGLGWLFKATGKADYLALIERTVADIESYLASPSGGWAESEAQDLPRRQNPHMHLFEAFMALCETTGQPRFLARAAEIFSLFRIRFYDEERGYLYEFFGRDWSLLPDGGSEKFEPGHFVEWVWLLRRYERLTGSDVSRFCDALLTNAEKIGLKGGGFLVDEVDGAGNLRLDRRRFWSQTEYMKALMVEAGARRDPSLKAKADALAGRVLATYVADGVKGCFIDQYSAEGKPTADHVPASIPYHILAVLPEIRLLEATGV